MGYLFYPCEYVYGYNLIPTGRYKFLKDYNFYLTGTNMDKHYPAGTYLPSHNFVDIFYDVKTQSLLICILSLILFSVFVRTTIIFIVHFYLKIRKFIYLKRDYQATIKHLQCDRSKIELASDDGVTTSIRNAKMTVKGTGKP